MRYFIYELLGWPLGPIVLQTLRVPGHDSAYHSDPINGYESLEVAESVLSFQQDEGKLHGHYVILPVYHQKRKIT